MDMKAIEVAVAATLGRTPESLNQSGNAIRAFRHTGWMASEPWVVAPETVLADIIDHTLLKPDAVPDDIVRLCQEAKTYRFPAVCVNPVYVSHAAAVLVGTTVRIATVVGFPLGATPGLVKASEAVTCVAHGASEIDMVIHVGALKAGNLSAVFSDVGCVVEAVGSRALVKVILETAYLRDEEIVRACLLCQWAGADYVKTSTGFGPAGACVQHVALMRQVVGDRLGVKAAGGIRDAVGARDMVIAGASRIGTSRGPLLVGD